MTSVRGILWRAGAPARLLLLGAISLYRLTLSGVAGWAVPVLPHLLPLRGRGDPDSRGHRGVVPGGPASACAAIHSGEVGSIRSHGRHVG